MAALRNVDGFMLHGIAFFVLFMGGPAQPSASADKFTTSREIVIDYPDPRDNLSGISKIEIWLTRDHGRSWTKYGEDEDMVPPAVVTLRDDGPVGITLVAFDGATPPNSDQSLTAPGAKPMFTYNVDTMPPRIRLIHPREGKSFPAGEEMELIWYVADANLDEDSVKLEYRIGDDPSWQLGPRPLPGKQELTWTIPEHLKGDLRFRISARDKAGHRAEYSMQKPILIESGHRMYKALITGPQTTNQDVVQIQYQVSGLAPHDVGAVFLYQSLDDGLTWTLGGRDRDGVSPMEYRVPHADRVGLHLIVTDRKGGRAPAPVSGTPPQHVLSVDRTAPVVAGGFDFDGKHWRGRQMRRLWWKAEDRSLPENPVSISYSVDGGRSWKEFSSGHPASGELQFKVPSINTDAFRLKFEARDVYGNTGSFESQNIFVMSTSERILMKKAKSHYDVGNTLRSRGDLAGAEEEYRKAVEEWPEFFEAWNDLGYTHFLLKQYAEAVDDFHHAGEIKPDYPDVLYNLGVVHFHTGDTRKAMDSFLKCLDYDPRHVEAYWYVGKLYLEGGNARDARKAWQRIVDITSESHRLHRPAKDLLTKYH